MAYHLRKIRNTLRLFPTAKTIGFSTRANEGDGICSEQCKSTDPSTNLSRSKSASESHLPCLVPTSPGLPMTCSDLAHILRLPLSSASSDVASFLRVVRPTCDDILTLADTVTPEVHATSGSHDNLNLNTAHQNLSRWQETIPLEVLEERFVRDLGRFSNHICSPLSDSPVSNVTFGGCGSIGIGENHHHAFLSNQTDPAYLGKHGCLNSSDTSLKSDGPEGPGTGKSGPSPEQIQRIKEKLEKAVTRLVSGSQDYSILHKNVVMENNLFGDNKRSIGMVPYGMEILKLRLRVHAQFSNTTVELQSVTVLEQQGVVRIHWRLKGLSQLQTLKFWRFFQKGQISKDDYEWVDAFSYFHIGKDGLVHKHRIDRMIPDDQSGKDKIADKLREMLTPAKPLVS